VDFTYEQKSQFKRIHAEPEPLDAVQQARHDKLKAEYAQLDDAWLDSDEDDAPPRLAELEQLIDEIENRVCVWHPSQRAIAGVVVSVGHNGKVDIAEGLVLPEDMPDQKAKGKPAARPGSEAQSSGIPASLVESMTAHRSAALAASLLGAPDKALAIAVYALAIDIFGRSDRAAPAISAKPQSLHRVEGAPVFQRLEEART
jgi:ParB family chromosome partitioning protein